MSLKNPKNFKKMLKNIQPEISELHFLKTLIFPIALKVTKLS